MSHGPSSNSLWENGPEGQNRRSSRRRRSELSNHVGSIQSLTHGEELHPSGRYHQNASWNVNNDTDSCSPREEQTYGRRSYKEGGFGRNSLREKMDAPSINICPSCRHKENGFERSSAVQRNTSPEAPQDYLVSYSSGESALPRSFREQKNDAYYDEVSSERGKYQNSRIPPQEGVIFARRSRDLFTDKRTISKPPTAIDSGYQSSVARQSYPCHADQRKQNNRLPRGMLSSETMGVSKPYDSSPWRPSRPNLSASYSRVARDRYPMSIASDHFAQQRHEHNSDSNTTMQPACSKRTNCNRVSSFLPPEFITLVFTLLKATFMVFGGFFAICFIQDVNHFFVFGVVINIIAMVYIESVRYLSRFV